MDKVTMNRALTIAHNAGAGSGPVFDAWSPADVQRAVWYACWDAGRSAADVFCDAADGDVWPLNGEAPVFALPR